MSIKFHVLASQLPAALVLAATACGVEPQAPDTGSSTSDLLGADTDPGDKWSLGVCIGTRAATGACAPVGTPGSAKCTGTLVAPNLVLTARHCVENWVFDQPAFCDGHFTGVVKGPIAVTASDSVFDADARWYAVDQVIAPPGSAACVDDVAFLLLKGKVTDALPNGIDLRRNVARTPPDEVVIVGRGAIREKFDITTGAKIENDIGNYERRKREHIPFSCASDGEGACTVVDFLSDPPSFTLPSGLVAIGQATGAGDSGAGVIAQDTFSHSTLQWPFAVNTLFTLGADGFENFAEGVRMDRHRRFALSTASTAAAQGGYALPLWAVQGTTE
jgi:hypothetical protein